MEDCYISLIDINRTDILLNIAKNIIEKYKNKKLTSGYTCFEKYNLNWMIRYGPTKINVYVSNPIMIKLDSGMIINDCTPTNEMKLIYEYSY